MKSVLLRPWCAAATVIVLASLQGALSQASPTLSQLAGELYPGYTVLQLSPTKTSSIQDAVLQAQEGAPEPPGAFVILLNSNIGTLLVDAPLSMDTQGTPMKWVIATAEGLQAAAAATALPAASLLVVRCGALKKGSFVESIDGFDSLELLGLSIQDCPGSAIDLSYGNKLVLSNTQLLSNNLKQKADLGGALLLTEISKVDVTHVACKGNFAALNGGCLNGYKIGQFSATSSTFSNNWRSAEEIDGRLYGGGALFFEQSDSIAVSKSVFTSNAALYGLGGGLFCSDCMDLSVSSSVFSNNSALKGGGGIFAGEVKSVTITDCNFTENGKLPGGDVTFNGAAISATGGQTTNDKNVNLVIRSSTFAGNIAGGGTVHALQYGMGEGRVEVHSCLFSDNEGTDEASSIFIDENHYTSVNITESTFKRNKGPIGSALACYDCDATITDCIFDTNEAYDLDGGALQFYNMQAGGSGNKLSIARCSFLNNTALKYGGAVAVYAQSLDIQDSEFTLNLGGGGGAVYVENAPTVTVSNTVFEENTAESSGGAVRLNTVGEVSFDGLALNNNMALSSTLAQGGGIVMFTVASATINNTNITNSIASTAGGGIAVLSSGNITVSNSIIADNTAPLGAGMAVDSSAVGMQNVLMTGNIAKEEEAEEYDDDEGARRRLHQAPASKGAAIFQFASESYGRTAGGALLAQQAGLKLQDCTLDNNTAAGDAGAVLLQQPTDMAVSNTYFTHNVAESGMGAGVVLRGIGDAVAAVGIKNCTFANNAAKLGSGGAAVIDSGLGVLDVSCEACIFEGNTAGGAGGAVAANGPTSFTCTDCQSQQNTASQQGGWMHCNGCSNTSITAGKSTNNSAGAAGGSISCIDCGTFTTKGYEYNANKASSGGAVAVQTAANVAITDCIVTENAAGNATMAPVLSPVIKRVYELPAAWQNLYGAGSATAGLGCNADGAGGGLCLAAAEAANIADNTLTANQGSIGGALFAAANCDASQPDCQSNKVNVTDLTARRNKAMEAGGVLYTTTPNSVQLGAAGQDPNSPEGMRQRASIVQQLTEDNQVGPNGYGPAVASFPSDISLMWPLQEGKSTLEAPPAAAVPLPGPGRTARKLQQLPLPNNEAGAAARATLNDLQHKVDSVYQIYSTAAAGTSKSLQPFCPALGASVLETHVVAVDSNHNFSIPINILDDFGSKVLSGPGSNWMVALRQNSAGRQLTGALRGQLSGGSVVLQGLSIQAEPGSNLTLTLAAIPPPGSGDEPLSATIQVRMRPCLAGEYVVFSKSSAGQIQGCSACAAPMCSFTAYPPPGSTDSGGVCQSCPDRGICVAGMVIPESGCYQAHPRSAVIRKCPHTSACERDANSLRNLQGLQCSYRRYINPEEIDPRPYTQMQCNRGYAGPFCSSCYRAGRNTWLLQQLERSGAPDKGYTIADEVVITTGQTNFEKNEVFGRSNGRCSRCPHLALAWIGFILSRGLDMLVIAFIAILWMGFGSLSQSAAVAAFVELKQQHQAELRLRSSILGTRTSSVGSHLSGTLSKPLRSASSGRLRTPNNSAAALGRAVAPSAAAKPPSASYGSGVQTQGSVAPCVSAHGAPLSFTGTGSNPPISGASSVSAFAAAPGDILPPVLSDGPSATSGGGRRRSSLFYNVYGAPSLHWASAVNLVETLRQHYARSAAMSADGVGSLETADPIAVQQAALLLMAVKHLACLAQVVLDGAQIAAVLLSQDLMFYVPDWAATALSAVLLTQANTWQYVPFECLIPGGSATSAAVVQTVVVVLLPIMYTAALYPLLMSVLSLSEHWRGKHAGAFEPPHTKMSVGPSKLPEAVSRPLHQQSKQYKSRNSWMVLTTVIVATMAYCYSFYVANIAAAFNCMSLTTAVTVPGEARIKGMVWVPDMQLACTSAPQSAAMVLAAVIGIPLLVGYWMLLLTLAWPTHAASPAEVSSSSHRFPAVRALSNFWCNIKRATLIPFRMLEHPVRVLQQYTMRVGVSGESCAALDVWNVEWRWWWLCGREILKCVLVTVATVTTMRGPEAQARVLLLLVVLAAAISWRAQAGCSTSMNQLQFVVFCWLQLLALFVVIPSLSGVNAAGFGGFLVALVALVMAQCAFVMACLVLRCFACTGDIGAAVDDKALPHIGDDE